MALPPGYRAACVNVAAILLLCLSPPIVAQLILVFLPVPAHPQGGRILSVSTADPTCQGQSQSLCYATIQAAVDAAQAGDTIRIPPGTYVERVTIAGKNGVATATEADRITLEADPAAPVGSVILQGAVTQCTNGYAIKLQQSKFITIRGLTITGAGGQAISLLGGNNQNHAIYIERNRIVGNGSPECNGGITIARGNPNTLILNNLIYGNGRNGITFLDADGGPHYVIHNTIHGNAWSGVSVARSHEVLLLNNLITGNGTASGATGGRVGVKREDSTSPQPQGIHLVNNLLCGNRLGELSGPVLDATDVGNISPAGTEGLGIEASPGCDVASTLYSNVPGPDGVPNTTDDAFTLTLASPAVDRGLDPRTLGLDAVICARLVADFDGEARRPQDGNASGTAEFDLGAVEVMPAQAMITGVAPTSGVHGRTLTLTVTGERLGGATALTFLHDGNPDSAITTNDFQVNPEGTELQATVTLGGEAALGARVVQVISAGGTSVAVPAPGNTFTVLGQLTLVPDFVTLPVGGQGALTVVLSASAPPGGLAVALESAAPGIATVTSPVSITAGATSGSTTMAGLAAGLTNLTATAAGFASGLAIVTVTPPTLVGLAISPENPFVPWGQQAQLTATGTFTNGSAQDLTAQVSWSSGAPLVAAVSDAGLVTGLTAGTTTITATHTNGVIASTRVTVLPPPPPTVVSLEPASLSFAQGGSGILIVTLSAPQSDVTTISLTSSIPAVASVPASVTVPAGTLAVPIPVAVGLPGTATITATLNGSSRESIVTVTPEGPSLISLFPGAVRMAPGASATFTITLSETAPADTVVSVICDTPSIAAGPVGTAVTIPAGQSSQTLSVTAIAPGSATITATLNGSSVESRVAVTTTAPSVVSLVPTVLGLAEGATGILTVTLSAVQPVETVVGITAEEPWAVALPASQVIVPANAISATVPIRGVYSSVTTVTATLNESAVSAGIWVRRTLPALRTLTCPPALAIGATGRCALTLNAIHSADLDVPVTVVDPTVVGAPATVRVPANAGTATFAVTGAGSGTGEVRIGPVNETIQQATIEVGPLAAAVVGVEPGAVVVAPEATTTLTVTLNAVQPTVTHLPITVSPTGVVDVPTRLLVPAGERAAVVPLTGLAAGTATLTIGPLGGETREVPVTVDPTPPTIVSILPTDATILAFWASPLTLHLDAAQATPTVVPVATDGPAWLLRVPATVTVPAGATVAAFPVVTFDFGTASVTAGPFNGGTAQATVTVVGTETTSVAIVPSAANIALGETQQFKALHAYSNGIVGDTTLWSTWTSSNTEVAKVVAKGKVTGVAPGTVTITARSEGGVTGTAVLTVGLPPATAIDITPAAATVAAGNTIAFHAVATFADGSTEDVTSQVQWMVGSMNVAVMTSPGGLATGMSPGSTTVIARLGNVGGTATLTVTPAVLTGLTVTPTAITRALGDRVQFRVVGAYSDGTTQDFTSVVTWASANVAVATVSSPGGIATALAYGTTVITAVHSDGATASSTLTVSPLSPTITALVPFAGAVGSTVTVLGTSLGTTTGISFNGIPASFTILSGSQLAATVPLGATTGPVQVNTAGGTAMSPQAFTIATIPQVTIVTPVDGTSVAAGPVRVGGTVAGSTSEVGVSVNGIPAAMHNGEWSVEIPLGEGSQAITVTATDVIGGQATAIITVTGESVPSGRIKLQGLPVSGVPPLHVNWQVLNETGRQLVHVEFDPMATGTFDAPIPSLDNVRTTYSTPGIWLPVVRATDDQGQQYTTTATITVLDRAQIDAALQAKWGGMRAALRAEALEQALEFFAPEQRPRYQALFSALSNQLAQIGQDLGDIQLVYLVEQRAKYRLRRTQFYGGQLLTLTYYVYFIQDAGGIWRLEEF